MYNGPTWIYSTDSNCGIAKPRDHTAERVDPHVISHCELLLAFQDVVVKREGRFAATGSRNFESAILSL